MSHIAVFFLVLCRRPWTRKYELASSVWGCCSDSSVPVGTRILGKHVRPLVICEVLIWQVYSSNGNRPHAVLSHVEVERVFLRGTAQILSSASCSSYGSPVSRSFTMAVIEGSACLGFTTSRLVCSQLDTLSTFSKFYRRY